MHEIQTHQNELSSLKTFLLLMVPIAFVDMVNGYFALTGSPLPVSAAFKLLLIALALWYSARNSGLLLILALVVLITFYQNTTYTFNFMKDFSAILKSFMLPFLLLFFHVCRHRFTLLHSRLIQYIFLATFAVIVGNVLLGILGYGYTTYGSNPVGSGGYGFKGFIFAGNELGGLLLVTYPVVHLMFKQRGGLFQFGIDLAYLAVSFLIGTKSAMLGVVILVCFNNFIVEKSFKQRFAAITIMALSALTLFTYFFDLIFIVLDRFAYIYNKLGILHLVFSGRYDFLTEAMQYMDIHFSAMDYLFGVGQSFADRQFKSVEMDIFDLLIWHGAIWTLLVYCAAIMLFMYCWRHARSPLIVLMLMLLGFVSIVAGHILTSAMITPMLALYYPLLKGSSDE